MSTYLERHWITLLLLSLSTKSVKKSKITCTIWRFREEDAGTLDKREEKEEVIEEAKEDEEERKRKRKQVQLKKKIYE